MKIRTLIVDDEPRARNRMRRLLGDHPDIEVVGEASDGDEAIAAVLQLRPQVAFFDVQMPGKTGLEAVRQLQAMVPEGMRPMVIFTTAHEEHAIDAFAVDSVDYLLKPVERARLAEALRRVRRNVWSPPAAAPAPTPAAPPPEPKEKEEPELLAGHRRDRIIPIEVADLAAVTVEDTITWAHTPGARLRMKMALHEVELKLPSPRFVRVSRAAIVQVDWVAELRPQDSGTWLAILRHPMKLEVPVSRRRAKHLRTLLDF